MKCTDTLLKEKKKKRKKEQIQLSLGEMKKTNLRKKVYLDIFKIFKYFSIFSFFFTISTSFVGYFIR